jgi:hypothetical protein
MAFCYFGKSVYQRIDNIYALEFVSSVTQARWFDGNDSLHLKMTQEKYNKIVDELLKVSNKFVLIDGKIFQPSMISCICTADVRFINGKKFDFKEHIKDTRALKKFFNNFQPAHSESTPLIEKLDLIVKKLDDIVYGPEGEAAKAAKEDFEKHISS